MSQIESSCARATAGIARTAPKDAAEPKSLRLLSRIYSTYLPSEPDGAPINTGPTMPQFR
jgi:hypothetical protein